MGITEEIPSIPMNLIVAKPQVIYARPLSDRRACEQPRALPTGVTPNSRAASFIEAELIESALKPQVVEAELMPTVDLHNQRLLHIMQQCRASVVDSTVLSAYCR